MDDLEQTSAGFASSRQSSRISMTLDDSATIKASSSSTMMPQLSGQITPPAKDYNSDGLITSKAQITEELTPPTTPKKSPQQSSAIKMADSTTTLQGSQELIPFKGIYTVGHEIGEGAWSKVSGAHLVSYGPSHGYDGSHASAVALQLSEARKSSLAIKTASHNMAAPIVKEEARILSYLANKPKCLKHVIAFFGWEEEGSSLVLERACLDISLSSSIEAVTVGIMQENMSKRPFGTLIADGVQSPSTNEPICGSQNWLTLASSLVSSLAWLHSQDVIHGDIKPANILWTHDNHFVLADFSSSRIASSSNGIIRSTDAITTMYASPELLKSYSISNPPQDQSARHATTASDVWALACTLLYAATGHEPYAFEKHRMRRILMAKDGCVISGYANADDWRIGRKVRAGELVECAVRPALAKVVDKRIACEEWVVHIREIAEEKGYTI